MKGSKCPKGAITLVYRWTIEQEESKRELVFGIK